MTNSLNSQNIECVPKSFLLPPRLYYVQVAVFNYIHRFNTPAASKSGLCLGLGLPLAARSVET